MVRTVFSAVFAACTLVAVVSAQTSLYVPGFDPQPISANEIGVGADGRTTWELVPGVTSGSFDDSGFVGTATLIAGPSDAQLILSDAADSLYLSESCAIANGIANCNVVAAQGTMSTTDVATETVVPFEIQGGTAAAGASSPPPTSTPSSGSTPGSGPAQTSSPSQSKSGSPSETQSSASGSPTGSQNNGAAAGITIMGMQTAASSIMAAWALAGLSMLVLA